MLKIKEINKSFDGKNVLNNISLEVNDNDRIGLIGSNGTGKSTLLKIIFGEEKAESGAIKIKNKNLIGYLPQEFDIVDYSKTVESYIKEYVGISKLESRMKTLEKDLENQDNLDEFCKLQEIFISLGGYNFEYRLNNVLNGLGISSKKNNEKVSNLSGGQRSKVLLAGVLLRECKLLLLDEPTNNLDLTAIQWIENYLLKVNIPYIVISHDRKFLDNVVNKIIELDYFERKLIEYPGNYSQYCEFKKREQERKLNEYYEQQNKIIKIKESLKEKKDWARNGGKQEVKDKDKLTRGYERNRSSSLASQAKNIEKRIGNMKLLERPKIKNTLKITVDYSKIKGSTAIQAGKLICGYNDGFKTNIINFVCDFGQRVVIIGNNGAGKSTFIRTLLGKIKPIEGNVNIGSGLKIGYIEQDSQINLDLSVEDYMIKNSNAEKSFIFTTLHQFNFDYEIKNKKYSKLSPGERTRLKLATFCLNEINTLVLDEPTNHLDIEALEALEEAMKTFKGTVIAITHDRYFVDQLKPTKVLELKEGKLIENYKRIIV